MAKIPHKWVNRQSIEHGVNDSDFAGSLGHAQVSKSQNYDLTKERIFESRGGSKKTSASATGASEKVLKIVEYRAIASGVVTRNFLVFAGTSLYSYNSSNKTYSTIDTGLSGNKPSVATFRNSSGADVLYYTEGSVFKYTDGSTATSILASFQLGAAGSTIPRYIHMQHQRLWAGGGTCDPNRVFYSPGTPAHPEQTWGGFDYVTLQGIENFKGIAAFYNHIAVGAEDSMHVITGRGGHAGDPYIPVAVSPKIGTTSHWSMIAHGGFLYWANDAGLYIGKLRSLTSDGMRVERISQNVQNTFNGIASGAWDDIEAAFFAKKEEIYWSIRDDGSTNPNKLLVYSTSLSNPELDNPEQGRDTRFVWSGYHTGLDYNSIGTVKDSNGLEKMYVGGSDGFVREYYSEYLEDRSSADIGGTSVDYEMRPAEEAWGIPSNKSRVYAIHPSVHLRKNSTLQLEYIVNQAQRLPDNPKVITLRGNVPYLHTTDITVTSTLGSSILTEKPKATAELRIGKKCKSFQPIFTNVGGDVDGEAYSYSGISYEIQAK
jgi:hypothetical protein